MDAELKAKWLAALRSGEYRQGITHLRTLQNTYCCIGVLCDVAGLEWEPDGYAPAFKIKDSPPHMGTALLWDSMLKVLGLRHEHMATLTSKNDCGASFSEIADWIEVNVRASSSKELPNG